MNYDSLTKHGRKKKYFSMSIFFSFLKKTCTLNIMVKEKKYIYNVSQLGMLAEASFTIFTRVT